MTAPLYTRAFLAACAIHLVGALSLAMWFLLHPVRRPVAATAEGGGA